MQEDYCRRRIKHNRQRAKRALLVCMVSCSERGFSSARRIEAGKSGARCVKNDAWQVASTLASRVRRIERPTRQQWSVCIAQSAHYAEEPASWESTAVWLERFACRYRYSSVRFWVRLCVVRFTYPLRLTHNCARLHTHCSVETIETYCLRLCMCDARPASVTRKLCECVNHECE